MQLSAQQSANYSFRHIDQTNGLLHNNIFGIQQDAKGYIWLLTPNGLQRYDGSRFVNYQGIVNDPASGSTDGAELFVDTLKNEIRVLKKNKIEILHVQTNRFTIYDPPSLLHNNTLKFDAYTDSSNNWMISERGAFLISPDKKDIKNVQLNIQPIKSRTSNTLVNDPVLHKTWLTTETDLVLFDDRSKKVFTKNNNAINDPLLNIITDKKNRQRLIMIDSRGNYWVTTWGHLFYKFNYETGKLITYDLQAYKKEPTKNTDVDATLLVNVIFEDNHHNIWIGTENAGLLAYNNSTESFTPIVPDPKNKQSIQYNYKIYNITQDREENIWIGTDQGISIFNPYRQYFITIKHDDDKPSVPKNEITDVIQTAAGDILIGTWGGGIAVYDKQWNYKKTISFSGPYQYNMIWSFAAADDGTIWAGCQHGYLHKYNPSTGSVVTTRPPELDGSTVRCMIKDAGGNIWFGLHNGRIATWNKLANKFYPGTDSVPIVQRNRKPVVKLFIDQQQHFWASTENGLKQYDPVKRQFVATYVTDLKNKSSMSGSSSQGIENYDDSTLIIGTVYGGLNLFNKNSKTFSHITTADGLPSNNIYALKKDTANVVWLTTDYDLYTLKPATKKFVQYNIGAGFINSAFTMPGFYALEDGRWLTASSTEVVCFQPNNTVQANLKETVEITGFRLFDKPIFIDSLLYQNEPLKLSYNNNFITIEFALLNFSNLQQTKYQYKLSGVNKDWVNSDTKNFASYTNLAPGTYIFSVRTDHDNASAVTAFKIIIAPPFWKTWWFLLTCILLASLIVYSLIRRRIKNIQHEANLKQKISETEMMALRAQMNPHFIFNCLNSIDNLIQMDEKEKATLYLSKFAKLIRSILETSVNNTVPCWKDIETLQLYLQLEALRFDHKFSYEVNVSNDILNGDYKVPPLVIQPFVENAIHHGLLNKIDPDKKLVVTVTADQSHIFYRIDDNGIGRTKAAAYKSLNKPAHESMGMQITTDRINLFNQDKNGSVKITDLYDADGNPSGTSVEVTLINQS